MDETLVSVIMPTYERNEKVIKRAIDSVINQTYKNWELIVVDDNKKDEVSKNVQTILNEINDTRIIYIKNKENMGSAKSRNHGIEKSKGKYITFLDDDDEYLPLKIEIQVNKMIEKDADYSITNLNLFNDENILVRSRKHDYIEKENNLLVTHLKHHLTGTDTFMFKKDYLIKTGMFGKLDSGDEFYLMMNAINNNGEFLWIDECYVKAYVHSDGSGLSTNQKREDGENMLFEFKKQYFDKLSKKDIKFIKVRHILVLAKISLDGKKYIKTLVYMIKAALIDFNAVFYLKKNY